MSAFFLTMEQALSDHALFLSLSLSLSHFDILSIFHALSLLTLLQPVEDQDTEGIKEKAHKERDNIDVRLTDETGHFNFFAGSDMIVRIS
jgi:hypothetical protein